MQKNWKDGVERKRRTNQLVRRITQHALSNVIDLPKQLYGICRLTWITKPYDDTNCAYIKSTKIPGLGDALQRDYSDSTLSRVAQDVASILSMDDVKPLVLGHTGFTNYYNAFRGSCLDWLGEHEDVVFDLFTQAINLKYDEEGLQIIRSVMNLPKIPRGGEQGHPGNPENLLTPVLFSLDERIRFPIINGSPRVTNLLRKMGKRNVSMEEQYKIMVSFYGKQGISDAAELDEASDVKFRLIGQSMLESTGSTLQIKETNGRSLPLKDENDIIALYEAISIPHRRLHNSLTNSLRAQLCQYSLREGEASVALFDILVENYDDQGNDLLIEAKSSVEISSIRMAVGQLYDYWFRIKGSSEPHLAILLPSPPDGDTTDMLRWMKIGVIWVDDNRLCTSDEKLLRLCSS